MSVVSFANYSIGEGHRPLLIAGPCVLESLDIAARVCETAMSVATKLKLPYIFKASFDKANRTSGEAFRGPGMDEGLSLLDSIKQKFQVPVTTDIHLPEQAVAAAQACDLLQIPAFLARQTDLLLAAAATGKAMNVKKGQFMSPMDMQHVVAKIRNSGNSKVMLCERGTFFGYGRLVNDFQAIPIMRSFDVPVIFDATHSVQQPGGLGGATGGNRAMVEPMARAAAAVGVDGFFFEVHPDPDNAPSDGPNMLRLQDFEAVLGRVIKIWETASEMGA
jgi:2-dehydro-3-deoxyphosphooctonate aldolase (KDO 8-P synthase)